MTDTLKTDPGISSFSLYSGKIAVGAAPNELQITRLKTLGFTHIVSLLTKEENATQWRRQSRNAGFEWLWMSVHQTLSASEVQRTHLQQYLVELTQILKEGARIYIYCDESLRRCALMCYALCHACRVPSSSAYPILHSLPALNANSLTRDSLHWAAQLGAGAPKP